MSNAGFKFGLVSPKPTIKTKTESVDNFFNELFHYCKIVSMNFVKNIWKCQAKHKKKYHLFSESPSIPTRWPNGQHQKTKPNLI